MGLLTYFKKTAVGSEKNLIGVVDSAKLLKEANIKRLDGIKKGIFLPAFQMIKGQLMPSNVVHDNFASAVLKQRENIRACHPMSTESDLDDMVEQQIQEALKYYQSYSKIMLSVAGFAFLIFAWRAVSDANPIVSFATLLVSSSMFAIGMRLAFKAWQITHRRLGGFKEWSTDAGAWFTGL